ncbi:MAG: PEGA domain-containing protein [Candidatus Bipolaricaulota bacterium]|nr:PEGA domain-containing protein [Candidatus Bipolaricaulota bacterium]
MVKKEPDLAGEVGGVKKVLQTSSIVILGLLFLVYPGRAQDRGPAPEGIIAKPPESSALEVEIELTRSRYRPGGEVEMKIGLTKKAYLYLYNIDTEGRVNLLFPNKYDKNNRVGPGNFTLPGNGYSFVTGGKEGTEYLGAIASTKPLGLFTSIDQAEFKENPFPRLSRSAQSFALTGKEKISSDVSQNDWATTWAMVKVTKRLSDLSVDSSPQSAEVYVDGNFVGTTPGTVSVEPGTREVTLKRSNYEHWSTTVLVQPYKKKRIEADLRPTTITRLTVKSTPKGADVYVDGKFQGKTPVSFFTESGNRKVRVSKQGYEVWEEVIDIQPYLNRNLEINLRNIKFSRVSVESSPSKASLYVDGTYRGTTPTELRLQADKRLQMVLRKKGYDQWERVLTLTPEREKNISVNLRPPVEKEPDSRTGKPELSLRFNGGGIFGYVFSLGSEIEVNNFVFGVSFRTTGNPEVFQEINWVSGSWEGVEVLNYGPELEGNFGYELDLFRGFHLRIGSGLALQPKAHLEPLESQTSNLGNIRPMFEIKRDARLGIDPHLTVHGGIGVDGDRYSIDLIFHNRRGPVLNFGFKF